MRKTLSVLVALNFILLGCLFLPLNMVRAQLPSFAPDPCGYYGTVKTAFTTPSRAQITTATTTLLSGVTTGKQHFVCGYQISTGSTTTANTWQFEYGTQTTTPCDTGATTITPAMNTNGALTGVFSFGDAAEMMFSTPASQQLCLVTTIGTGPSIGIWGTEVVQ